jgi:hypothetical protein
VLFMGGVGLLFVPRPYSTWLLIALVALMLYLSMKNAPSTGWQPVRLAVWSFNSLLGPLLRRIWQWISVHRQHLAYPTAALACALMALSAYNFRPENGGLPIDDAAREMVAGGVLLGAAMWLSKQKTTVVEAQHVAPVLTTATKTRWWSLSLGLGVWVFLMWVNSLPYKNEYDLPINDVLPLNVHQQIVLWIVALIMITRGLIGREKNLTDEQSKQVSPASLREKLIGRLKSFVQSLRELNPLHLLRSGVQSLKAQLETLRQVSLSTKLELVAVAAILIVTFALRTYNLELIHRFVDEIHWFDAVPRVWDFETNIRIFLPFSDVTAFTWIYPYFEWSFVNTMGPSFTAMRLLSAIVGTAGVAATYYLARILFDRPTALLSMLLLATFPVHIQFSRITLNNIADPLFGVLALAFLSHAMKTWKRRYFVLAGVALGLTQYFYEGGRLLYPPLVGVFALYWFMQPIPTRAGESKFEVQSRTWQLMGHLGLLFVTALLIALPVYSTLAAFHLPVTVRLNEMGYENRYWMEALTGGSNAYWEHLLRNTLAYIQLPELGWFYGGVTPLILSFVVPVFFLGLWHALYRIRQTGMFLLILWLVAATVGTSLTRDLWSARYVVVFPALMIFVALGIRLTLPMLAPILGVARNLLRDDDTPPDTRPVYERKYSRMLAVLMTALALLIGTAQVRYYFGEHIDVYVNQARFGGDVHDALFRAVSLPHGTYVHVITDQNLFQFDVQAIVRFWNRQSDLVVDIQPRSTLTLAYFREQPLGYAHAFFIDLGDEQVVAMMHEYFLTEPPRISPYNVPTEYQMMLYYSPVGSRVER